MIAAEKWYEHQANYQKYGFEMKPARAVKKPAEEDKELRRVQAKDKARLFLLTIFAGLLGICLIISAAYCAQIQYDINGMLADADAVRGEIENLNVAIKSATNITIIEEKATNLLGMVYPSSNQIAYLNATEDQDENFALKLKQIAYKQ